MKILIIEDEKAASDRLQRLLKSIDSNFEIVSVIDTVEESVSWFANNPHPDLVFMDIQLLDGMSFEIFDEVHIKSPVVFITSFNEFAIQAFKRNGIYYILKPVDIEELKKGLEKYEQLKKQFENESIDTHALYKSMAVDKPHFKSRFLFKRGQTYVSVLAEDICCFYIENQLVSAIAKDKACYSVDNTLDELEKLLDPFLFFRANRQHIINVNAVNTVHNYFNGKLKVVLKVEIPSEIVISREKASVFKSWLDT